MRSLAILALFFSPLSTTATIPGARELKLALEGDQRTPVSIRAVGCKGFPEEPTEFECGYERLVKAGEEHSLTKEYWQRRTAIIAIDGRRWILLDESIPGAR
jgi:hypothetical protein